MADYIRTLSSWVRNLLRSDMFSLFHPRAKVRVYILLVPTLGLLLELCTITGYPQFQTRPLQPLISVTCKCDDMISFPLVKVFLRLKVYPFGRTRLNFDNVVRYKAASHTKPYQSQNHFVYEA